MELLLPTKIPFYAFNVDTKAALIVRDPSSNRLMVPSILSNQPKDRTVEQISDDWDNKKLLVSDFPYIGRLMLNSYYSYLIPAIAEEEQYYIDIQEYEYNDHYRYLIEIFNEDTYYKATIYPYWDLQSKNINQLKEIFIPSQRFYIQDFLMSIQLLNSNRKPLELPPFLDIDFYSNIGMEREYIKLD